MKNNKIEHHSFFSSSFKGILLLIFLYLFIFLIGSPIVLIFINADRIGIMWFPLILFYSAFLMLITNLIQNYRKILSIRIHFSDQEFKELFPNDYKFIKIIEKINILEKIIKNT